VFHLGLQVGKRREGPSPELVKLILQEHDLFFLLLDHVHQAALVRDLLDLLLRVRVSVVVGLGLQALDLLALLHVLLELASFDLELLILKNLLFDLFAQLSLSRFECCDTLFSVLRQLFLLRVKALLVIFLLLDVLALDDLLSLLGNSIQLNIFSELLKMLLLCLEALVLVLDLLELGLVDQDTADSTNLDPTTLSKMLVLIFNIFTLNENGVLVVCGDGKLGNLDLALLQVHNHLKVVLQFFDPSQSLALLGRNHIKLFLLLHNIPLVELNKLLQI
jgi:hypothetical protein